MEATRVERAEVAAKLPDISEEVWDRLSPEGWGNAVITGGLAMQRRSCVMSSSHGDIDTSCYFSM